MTICTIFYTTFSDASEHPLSHLRQVLAIVLYPSFHVRGVIINEHDLDLADRREDGLQLCMDRTACLEQAKCRWIAKQTRPFVFSLDAASFGQTESIWASLSSMAHIICVNQLLIDVETQFWWQSRQRQR